MTKASDIVDHIHSPLLQKLVQYWFDQRGDDVVTRRQSFDPIDLPKLLPYIFLLQYRPERQSFDLRLAGEEIGKILLVSTPGSPFETLLPRSYMPVALERYRRVRDDAALMHGLGRIYVNLGGTGVGERIAMPLADAEGRIGWVVGAAIYHISDGLPDGTDFDQREVSVRFHPLHNRLRQD